MDYSISPRLLAYLKSWFATSTGNKARSLVDVRLTFDEFLSLFETRQLASLQRAIDANRLRDQQSETNQMAYVLTWRSYAARSSNIFDRDTACVCSRMKSAKINLPQKGDTLRPEHRANIGRKLKGRPKTADHRAAISAGAKGTTKVKWSPERRAARSAEMKAKGRKK